MNQHPHGAMRRKEREITDRGEIDTILRSSKVMYLGLADQEIPFVVPVFFAYDGTSIYFHSAGAGTKIEILKRNPKVCFVVSVDQGFIESDKACDFEAKHRTVIGFGIANFIEDDAEKISGLDRIVALFSDQHFEYPKNNLHHTTVIRIDVQSLKGKMHG
jgi:nitroimidazol reductase NimA-like FMN-containing flavoprotein (pyridoxamine 5'-phosphate oxidase superfamily)